jgi:hypothetical protein
MTGLFKWRYWFARSERLSSGRTGLERSALDFRRNGRNRSLRRLVQRKDLAFLEGIFVEQDQQPADASVEERARLELEPVQMTQKGVSS